MYFSPNIDGRQDTVVLPLVSREQDDDVDLRDIIYSLVSRLNMKNADGEVYWEMVIYRKSEGSVKPLQVYHGSRALDQETLRNRKAFKKSHIKRGFAGIPASIEWDGISRMRKGERTISELVSDGSYLYQVRVYDSSGNSINSPPGRIVLDMRVPELKSIESYSIFSPNNDGNKDENEFTLRSTYLERADWAKINIYDRRRQLKKVFVLPGTAFTNDAAVCTWTGDDNEKNPVPEGVYYVVPEAGDLAGNRHIMPRHTLKLVRTMEKLQLSASLMEFSPDNNGYYDSLDLYLAASSTEGMEKWLLELKSTEDGRTKRAWQGEKNLLDTVTFDGRTKEGRDIPDGEYSARLKAWYNSGNNPSSGEVKLIIDRVPPGISLHLKSTNFVPAAEGMIRTMKIEQRVSGKGNETFYGVISDELGMEILRIDFKSNVDEQLVWDGRNQDGEILPGFYYYTMFGEDTAGNRSNVTTAKFELVGEKSIIGIRADQVAFSPNGDGVKDSINFLVSSTEKGRIISQRIDVYTRNGDVVRSLTRNKFTARVSWDGKDAKGRTTPDGKYFYGLRCVFNTGETPEVKGKSFYLDTVAPLVRFDFENNIFSPNGDGRLENLVIRQQKKKSLCNDAKDRIWITISDLEGKVFRRRERPWLGKIPGVIRWSGRGQQEREVPEGVYYYILNTEDLAGNRFELKKKFVLIRKVEKVVLDISSQYFSAHHANDKHREITMQPSFSLKKYLEGYRLDLFDMPRWKKYALAEISGDREVQWRGLEQKEGIVPDGVYHLTCRADFSNGNRPSSETRIITVDSTPPEISVFSSPRYFSPDDDGVNDTVRISINTSDNIELAKTEVYIFRRIELDRDGDEFSQDINNYLQNSPGVFKKLSWQGASGHTIEWDGIGDDGSLVESANDYIMFVRADDTAANRSIRPHILQVDVLVEKTADGMRINVNSINFKYNSDRMIGNFRETLDRIIRILHKFPDYSVRISGHTDSRGSDSYNMKLSQKRSEVVVNYLGRHGIEKGRLSADGRGESELLVSPEIVEGDDSATHENYRRNRRVEFYLIREE